MQANQNKYSPEFKLEAVFLVLDKGYSVTQACMALGVGPTALRRWIQLYKAEKEGLTPDGARALTPEQRQIQEMKKKIERLELEKDILKKATALLMQDELKYKR